MDPNDPEIIAKIKAAQFLMDQQDLKLARTEPLSPDRVPYRVPNRRDRRAAAAIARTRKKTT